MFKFCREGIDGVTVYVRVERMDVWEDSRGFATE